MSDLLNHQPDQTNSSPGAESGADASQKPDEPVVSNDSRPSRPAFHDNVSGEEQPPLPAEELAPDYEWPTVPLAHPGVENPFELPDRPVRSSYHVSPAEADWSDYTLPPLEEDEAPSADEGSSNWETVWSVVREVGETILLTLIIFFLIQTVIRNFRVVGTSMVDNLHDGQYLIIDKLSYTDLIWENVGIGGPQRGDVIVFEPPNRPGEDYVKRIIALPGETVEIKQGQVFINGQPLDEPFEPVPGSYTMPHPVTVPPDQVFVLGDNRNNSNDSHNWGTLPLDNIVGRAWLSYWPPSAWGVIPRDTPTEQATLRYFLQELVPGANAESEQ